MNIISRYLKFLFWRFFRLWLVLAYLIFSIIAFKPSTLPSWVVTIILVFPTFWFVFEGPAFLNNWQLNHRYVFASWLVFALKIALFLFALKFLAPHATLILEGWFHA